MACSRHNAFIGVPRAAILSVFAASFLLSGCVQKKIAITATANARTTAMNSSRVVAVLPFDGPGGEEATAVLEMMLHNAAAMQPASLTVVDRQHIEKIRAEQKMAPTGLDEPKAKKLGKLLGADTIITGRVTPLAKNEQYGTQQIFECTSWSEPKGFFKIRTCKQSQPKPVKCTNTTGSLKIQPRLIHVASGEVKYTKLQQAAVQVQHCENTAGAPTDDTLRSGAVTHAAVEIGRDLVPHRYVIEARLKLMPEGLAGAQRERFEGAVAFANAQRFDRACEIFNELQSSGTTALPVRFNAAVCEEAFGTLDMALLKIQEVDRSLGAPDADVNDALARITRRNAETRGLPATNASARSE